MSEVGDPFWAFYTPPEMPPRGPPDRGRIVELLLDFLLLFFAAAAFPAFFSSIYILAQTGGESLIKTPGMAWAWHHTTV